MPVARAEGLDLDFEPKRLSLYVPRRGAEVSDGGVKGSVVLYYKMGVCTVKVCGESVGEGMCPTSNVRSMSCEVRMCNDLVGPCFFRVLATA